MRNSCDARCGSGRRDWRRGSGEAAGPIPDAVDGPRRGGLREDRPRRPAGPCRPAVLAPPRARSGPRRRQSRQQALNAKRVGPSVFVRKPLNYGYQRGRGIRLHTALAASHRRRIASVSRHTCDLPPRSGKRSTHEMMRADGSVTLRSELIP